MAGGGSTYRRGGRQKGTPNKSTPKGRRLAEIKKSGLTPLEFMLNMLRDPNAGLPDRRWAAVNAAPYVHAKLQAAVKADGADLPTDLPMDDRELARRVALILVRAAEDDGDKTSAAGTLQAFAKPDKMH